jgi:DNA-directed RNA polymerase specialized sigma24 family protein
VGAERFSHVDMAAGLHILVGTGMSRVCRARTTLRGLLGGPAKPAVATAGAPAASR